MSQKESINGFVYFETKEEAFSYAGAENKSGKETDLKKIWPDPKGGYWSSPVAGKNPLLNQKVEAKKPVMEEA